MQEGGPGSVTVCDGSDKMRIPRRNGKDSKMRCSSMQSLVDCIKEREKMEESERQKKYR